MHQLVVGAFHLRIAPYLLTAPIARALTSPADVRRGDRRRNRVQPDLVAVRLIDGRRPPYPYLLSDLILALEVESPGNPMFDHHRKRELYLTGGVPEYWIASAEARIVTRWRSLDDPGDSARDRSPDLVRRSAGLIQRHGAQFLAPQPAANSERAVFDHATWIELRIRARRDKTIAIAMDR